MEANMVEPYAGIFFSEESNRIMVGGRILPNGGTAAQLMVQLMVRLAAAERILGERAPDTDDKLADFHEYVRRGICTLGTPLLTNIGKNGVTLGSCTAVPISAASLSVGDLDLAEEYYRLNMGSGYNLNDSVDPVSTLLCLNRHASSVERSGICERYVGNIAHLGISHPRILEFVKSKLQRSDLIHFNTSVDVSEHFFHTLTNGNSYLLDDGTTMPAARVWDAIVQAAWECGDPGIISLARYNEGNALAVESPYVTIAPCAEVGLAAGESCFFGYINVAACVRWSGGVAAPDLGLVGDVAECLTRVLDDAVQLSLAGLPSKVGRQVVNEKRKIGVGICGFADLLLWLGIDYGSDVCVQLLEDLLDTINYRSKVASVRLAERRGPFPAFARSAYALNPAFLLRFVRSNVDPQGTKWSDLAGRVAATGIRNVMTTALPPSGRSALLLGVNPSIEPYLTFGGPAQTVVIRALSSTGRIMVKDGRLTNIGAPDKTSPAEMETQPSPFMDAKSLSPRNHIRVLKVAAKNVDDGVSKTVNLSADSTIDDVNVVFRAAWEAGVKAVSVYRSGSRISPVMSA